MKNIKAKFTNSSLAQIKKHVYDNLNIKLYLTTYETTPSISQLVEIKNWLKLDEHLTSMKVEYIGNYRKCCWRLHVSNVSELKKLLKNYQLSNLDTNIECVSIKSISRMSKFAYTLIAITSSFIGIFGFILNCL